MSGDSSDTEAVLEALNEWYSRRIIRRYTGEAAKHILGSITAEAEALEAREKEALKADFARTFPLRGWPPSRGYFSHHYSRFEGYMANTWVGGSERDTREMETVAPVFVVREKVLELVDCLKCLGPPEAGVDDLSADAAFNNIFPGIAEFIEFCMGYLHTRLLNADVRSSWGVMPEWEYESRARNFRRVENSVSYFAEAVMGDILH